MTSSGSSQESRLKVLIAGAGVAGLEAAFALRALAGNRVDLTLLSPTDAFVYRPTAVLVPFGHGEPERFSLSDLAELAGAELIQDGLSEVVPRRHVAVTDSGSELSYDALLIALGTSSHQRYDHVSSVDDTRMEEVLRGLVLDVEEGYVHRLAFVIPAPTPWPLPAYELALMTAQRAWDTQADVKITIITPEAAPLAVFGTETSQQLAHLLAKRGIEVIPSANCDVTTSKTIRIHPGDRLLEVDRIVALPELRGPAVRGLPHDVTGFLPVDEYGRVTGVHGVWAAGDCTDYPIKQGGVAAQQADAVALSIAERAGASVMPEAFKPVLTGILLTGEKPMRLGADPGAAGPSPDPGVAPGLPQAAKIAARYLAPHLEQPVKLRA